MSRNLAPAGRLFAVAALLEAFTWTGLLIGMYFKYADGETTAVRVPGMTHGIVFLALVGLTLAVARLRRWDLRTLVLGLAASVLPLCSMIFEVWAHRTGRLAAPAADAAHGELAEATR